MRVDFFGDAIGTGEVKVIPERFGSIQLEGTVSRGGAVIVKISGPGACNDRVIGGSAATQFLIFYLNDIDEGGTTEFFYQGVGVRPAEGSR